MKTKQADIDAMLERIVQAHELKRKTALALVNMPMFRGSVFAKALYEEIHTSLDNAESFTAREAADSIAKIISDLQELIDALVENRDPENF